jgi:hypothetical protein
MTPTTLFVATQDGIFKSVNVDLGWSDIGPFAHKDILSLAIDPVTPTTMYAGDPRGWVFKTLDGQHWMKMHPVPMDGGVTALTVVRELPNILYAGTEEGSLYKSIDGGNSWHQLNIALPGSRILTLVLYPQSVDSLYVGTAANGLICIEPGETK